MAKFTKLNPKDVALGRGHATAEARKPYIEAVRSGQAGKIELTRGEKSATIRRLQCRHGGRFPRYAPA